MKLNSLKVEIPILGSSDGESPQLLLTGLHINIQIQHITSSKLITNCVYMINCQITEQHNQNLIHNMNNMNFIYTPTYILINTLQRHIRTCKYLLKLFSAQKLKYLKLLLVLTGQSVWQHMLIEPSRKFDQVWHFYGVSFITPSHQSINQQARKPRSYARMKPRKICRFCNWRCVGWGTWLKGDPAQKISAIFWKSS